MVKVIYYDLETTNLRPLTGPNGVEIVQIGAVCNWNKNIQKLGSHSGNPSGDGIYLVPNREISVGATQVHGLTRDELIEDKRTRRYWNVFSPKRGLQEFVKFVAQQREYSGEKILLVSSFFIVSRCVKRLK